jgi:hypothetical protein
VSELVAVLNISSLCSDVQEDVAEACLANISRAFNQTPLVLRPWCMHAGTGRWQEEQDEQA